MQVTINVTEAQIEKWARHDRQGFYDPCDVCAVVEAIRESLGPTYKGARIQAHYQGIFCTVDGQAVTIAAIPSEVGEYMQQMDAGQIIPACSFTVDILVDLEAQ